MNAQRASLLPFDGAYPVDSLEVGSAVNGYATGPGIACGAGQAQCGATYPAVVDVLLQAVPSSGYVRRMDRRLPG